MSLEVGTRLGHYEVTALIGEGGMGQVYRATDTKLNRQVALGLEHRQRQTSCAGTLLRGPCSSWRFSH